MRSSNGENGDSAKRKRSEDEDEDEEEEEMEVVNGKVCPVVKKFD